MSNGNDQGLNGGAPQPWPGGANVPPQRPGAVPPPLPGYAPTAPPPMAQSYPPPGYPHPPQPAGVARCWMVHDQGRQFGPHTEPELATLVAVGTVSPVALVWREGSPRWIPISAVVPIPAHLPPTPALPYSTAASSTDRIPAGICAILLGALGVHKFMLGYTGAGVTMLLVTILTCGFGGCVMCVIGIIEGILYLTKSDEQFHREYVVGRKAWF